MSAPKAMKATRHMRLIAITRQMLTQGLPISLAHDVSRVRGISGRHENLHDAIFTERDLPEHTDLHSAECGSCEKTADLA
jgi:hypothetical protein